MNKKQMITEYVGKGHPDIVADRISKIVNDYAETSATEVIINKAGVYISGETTLTKRNKKLAKKDIKKLLTEIATDYAFIGGVPKITFNFIKQDSMLAERKATRLAGDQEVVYYTKLEKGDAHYILRHIDNEVNKVTKTLDYKTLINLKTKEANLSISMSHKDSEQAMHVIIEELIKYIPRKNINVCIFEGGSIYNDTGVTGRKLIVEQSGCGNPHGGGAVYGKDSTKTAPAAHKLAREYAKKNKVNEVVVVYHPGNKLNKPQYIKENK